MHSISYRTLFVIFLALPIAALASFPATPGIFIIRGFSNSHLIWQPTDNGSAVDLGALGAGASRVRTGANYVLVANSGSFANGTGSALWYATFDSVARAINQQRPVTWHVCSFDDYSNAYDVAWSSGYAWVSMLGTSELKQVDLTTNSIITSIPTTANPQDVIATDGVVCVSCSGYGYGNTLFRYSIQQAYSDSFTVGINPQGLTVDPYNGELYIACSGRSWDTPVVHGGLSILVPQFGAVTAIDSAGGFNPASVCVTTNERVILSDEYGIPQCKQFLYNESTHIVTFAALPFTGGWQLLAIPDSGVLVVSAGDSAIRKYGADNLFVTEYPVGGVPAAAMYWQGQITSAPEPRNTLALQFELPQVYPNPFNATAQVHYRLPGESVVQVILFNANGQGVALLANGRQSAGEHVVAVDGTRLSSGTYFVALEASGKRAVRSIQLLK